MRGTRARQLLVILGTGLSACAQAPTEEVEMAAARVGRAREADASAHAPDMLDSAEAALLRARDYLSEKGHSRDAVDAAALACLRADEARFQALEARQRIERMTARCLMEIGALMDEARSRGGGRAHYGELESFASRQDALRALLDRGHIYEAQDGALALKDDLLRLLRVIEAKQT